MKNSFESTKSSGHAATDRKFDRRAFMQIASVAGGLGGLALAGCTAAKLSDQSTAPLVPETARYFPEFPTLPKDQDTDPLLRMQIELRRALANPIEQRHWRMVIDTRKCIGCNACTVACIAENNLPPGVTYRTVVDAEDGQYPNVRRFFMPTNCFQCENPPCVRGANAVIPGSMSIRPDRIVVIHYEKMKGKPVFEAARKACPYKAALYFDEGGNYTDSTPAVQQYEQREALEYGRKRPRAETVGITRKCHFCIQRIERGALPACVATCTGQAMHFGDQNDPGSLVAELTAQKKDTFVLTQEAGTKPDVIYVHNDPLNDTRSCASCHSGGNLP